MHLTSRTVFRVAPLLAVFLVAACGLTPPPQPPEDRFYRLEAAAPERVFDHPPIEGTVEVLRFSSVAMTDNRALLFSEDGGESLKRYSYHLWTDSPTVMLQAVLVDALESANAAERVVIPDLRIESDYNLDGRLLRLEHHVEDTGGGKVVVAIQIGLRATRAEDFVLLETYREEVPIDSDDPDAAAPAMQTGINRILDRFIGDLAAL